MTNIIKKNAKVLNNRELITGMGANGIVPSLNNKGTLIFTHCPMCEAELLADNPGYTKAILSNKPWYQATPVIVFKMPNGSTLKACCCGYRELVIITPKPRCSNCGSVLKNEGDRCYGPNCQPPTQQELDSIATEKKQAQEIKAAELKAKQEAKQKATKPPVKQCVTPGCTNPVPESRFVRCEACRATRRTPKEEACTEVQM